MAAGKKECPAVKGSLCKIGWYSYPRIGNETQSRGHGERLEKGGVWRGTALLNGDTELGRCTRTHPQERFALSRLNKARPASVGETLLSIARKRCEVTSDNLQLHPPLTGPPFSRRPEEVSAVSYGTSSTRVLSPPSHFRGCAVELVTLVTMAATSCSEQ